MSGARFTFRANRDLGRHGWLRLTPAYSVGLVAEALAICSSDDLVLDPFCGTGTTALVCAERGIASVTTDLNPFLIWLTCAKCRTYTRNQVTEAREFGQTLVIPGECDPIGIPPMQHMERWWDRRVIEELAFVRTTIEKAEVSGEAKDLLRVAFCRVVIEQSKASYRHQSVSLRRDISQQISNSLASASVAISESFRTAVESVSASVLATNPLLVPGIHLADARQLSDSLATLAGQITRVFTSPPYPNRMSYIRELRPYMYWTGFLNSTAEAGDLDWQAIGGTWGRATSNLTSWIEPRPVPLSSPDLVEAIVAIEARSLVLGRYVRKYVHDMAQHISSLRPLLAPGAAVQYVIGNSKFYDVMLDSERIFADLFQSAGLEAVSIESIRKRTSKRELYEYIVSARAPSA